MVARKVENMRFGTFHLPLSPSPEDDYRIIQEQLAQVEAAERLGFDSAWLTEHLFTGENVYGDPIPFAAALSARTSRITIGFAVVQMALHHPTRLAIQTALLDNLLQGRLIIGIGRGSAYNEFEYVAFGLRSEGQRERMFEAIDLLQRAWTEERVEHHGKFFDVFIPSIRPRPYQQPFPRLALSVLSDETLRWAAQRGFPVLFGRIEIAKMKERLDFYANAMADAGWNDGAIRNNLEQTTLLRSIYVAETDAKASADIQDPTFRLHAHLQETRGAFNPKDVDMRDRALYRWTNPEVSAEEAIAELMSRGFITGSPSTVAEQIAELRDAGVKNVMCTMTWGAMPHEQVLASMELFGKEIIPRFADTPVTS